MDFENNIFEAWARMLPEDRWAGRDWWPSAAADVADEAIRFGIRYERVAYAAAALSPGIPWVGTMQTLRLILEAHRDGLDMPRGSGHLTFGYRGRERAWGILQTGDTSLCRGPKVEAVAGCLLGIDDSVPVDRHLIRVATGENWSQVKPPTMLAIADATRAAAFAHGEAASSLQAGIWIVGSRNVVRKRKTA